MKIKVLSFGYLVEITGSELQVEATDTALLQSVLLNQFPALRNKRHAIAVNNKLVTGFRPLVEGDEVALLPPFSGG